MPIVIAKSFRAMSAELQRMILKLNVTTTLWGALVIFIIAMFFGAKRLFLLFWENGFGHSNIVAENCEAESSCTIVHREKCEAKLLLRGNEEQPESQTDLEEMVKYTIRKAEALAQPGQGGTVKQNLYGNFEEATQLFHAQRGLNALIRSTIKEVLNEMGSSRGSSSHGNKPNEAWDNSNLEETTQMVHAKSDFNALIRETIKEVLNEMGSKFNEEWDESISTYENKPNEALDASVVKCAEKGEKGVRLKEPDASSSHGNESIESWNVSANTVENMPNEALDSSGVNFVQQGFWHEEVNESVRHGNKPNEAYSMSPENKPNKEPNECIEAKIKNDCTSNRKDSCEGSKSGCSQNEVLDDATVDQLEQFVCLEKPNSSVTACIRKTNNAMEADSAECSKQRTAGVSMHCSLTMKHVGSLTDGAVDVSDSRMGAHYPRSNGKYSVKRVACGSLSRSLTTKDDVNSSIEGPVNEVDNRMEVSFDGTRAKKATCGFKLQSFTKDEITRTTKNFSIKIGEGGFGCVYKGTLDNGNQVAVKILSAFSRQGKQEFMNELESLSCVNHRRLVCLLGYCNERGELMLVYEYMPQGSLKDRLYGPKSEGKELSWRGRIQIALDAAQGLEYLHGGCNTKFIHRDIKTANILLDDNLRGKLSDFGLAKGMMDNEASHVTTLVKGTPGYLDPEYFNTQVLTDKSDIFSFGVVLFEIIFGRLAVDSALRNTEINLVKWVTPYLEMKRYKAFMKMIDKKLNGRFSSVKSIKTVGKLAMACVAEKLSCRPNVSQVVMILKQAIKEEDDAIMQPLFNIRIRGLNTIFWSEKSKPNQESPLQLESFTVDELAEATTNFSKRIASGAFGSLFPGNRRDGCQIAVIVLSSYAKQEFLDKREFLCLANHENLVSFLGCCDDLQKPMLVYEHMDGFSLKDLLYGPKSKVKKLNWKERLQIALDIAECVDYLHVRSTTPFVERKISTSNIFAGNSGRAKLSVFGFTSKINIHEAIKYLSFNRGNIYFSQAIQSDVYDFGMVLVELICSREVSSTWEFKEQGIMEGLQEQDVHNVESVYHITRLANACISECPSLRPNVGEVVTKLKEAMQLEDNLNSPMPPPTFYTCDPFYG